MAQSMIHIAHLLVTEKKRRLDSVNCRGELINIVKLNELLNYPNTRFYEPVLFHTLNDDVVFQ